ncbi:MAG TPA: response regulator [Gallionellaceae bacterium]|nr:response regulator [Gallionellaceae bacterium]
MSDRTIIFIVDDDAAVRDALAMLLEAAGYTVASFPGAADFLDAYTPDTRGCIILDVDMPGMDGTMLQEELKRRALRLPIIFLSGQGTIPVTVRAIKAGAMDFLTKPVDGSVLLARVREALKQDSLQQEQAADRQSIAFRLSTLTERQREIMMLTVAGGTSKEIARHLDISYRTVESHRAHILQKTGASNLVELTRIASQNESQ